MRAYYGSKLSPNQTETPEGFLICLNVPIARTGVQTYMASEMGISDDPNHLVDVMRTEEEVFSAATIASFEGKPATEDHPPVEITTDNIAAYSCGHVQNVHRGAGEESDLLIADLYITSRPLIDAIRSGRLREVSCGYDCDYRQDAQGRYYQTCIRGNHVAVVSAGRAGTRVAIKDSKQSETKERGKKIMAKKPNHKNLITKLFPAWAKDAEPEEMQQVLEEIQQLAASETEAQPEPAAPETAQPEEQKDGDETLAQIVAAIAALTEKVEALSAAKQATDDEEEETPPEEKALDELEKEVTGETDDDEEVEPLEDQEASVTVPAEEIGDEDEEETANASDRAVAAACMKALRKTIGKLPAEQRAAAVDSASKQIRKAMGKPARAQSNGYAAINQIMRQKAKSKDSKVVDSGAIGKSIMESRNPHYKKA